MVDFFKDLPILWVDNFSIVTETFLLEQYKILKNVKINIEKSTLKYWYNHIRNLHI
jgi:hypothetical protein